MSTDLPIFVPTAGNISILGRHFQDDKGRILGLRGANVGAASKVPVNKPKIHDHANGTYVNQPFPLSEAPDHWARLASWGLTFIRLNVTWDAIEHSGPGEYDHEYLSYLRQLLKSMKGTGLVAYVSVHQDVWSRYSGGSGAPGWTLEVAGLDLSDDGAALEKSGAAFLHGVKGGLIPGEKGLWPTGYQKLAAASMNTFFWAGETFAPGLKAGAKGTNIQQYLQDHFLGAWGALLDAVGDLDSVMGFEMMNEPHPGYIGLPTIDEWNYNTDLHLGEFPSPLQSFALGAGHPTTVPVYVRSFPHPTRISGRTVANADGVKAWTSQCPWEREGVWSFSTERNQPVALREDYFTKDSKGRTVNFYKDFYYPFLQRWEKLVNQKAPRKARMLEPIPNEFCPDWPEDSQPKNFVFAPHWYDLNTMFTKKFGSMTVNVQGLSRGKFPLSCVYFGKSVKDNYALQIRTLVTKAREKLGDVPIVIGECGIPMDLNREEAFTSGDWKWQARMLDALIYAMEQSHVAFNLWNYNPSNTDALGDDWNAENFSWFSNERSIKGNLDAGARLLDTIVRPYAIATSGTPLSSTFVPESLLYSHAWTEAPYYLPSPSSPPPGAKVTEIFLPSRLYESGKYKWHASPNARVKFDHPRQRVFIWFDDDDDTLIRADKKGINPTRRFDIWVHATQEARNPVEYIGLVIVIGGFVFFLLNEWKKHTTGQGWIEMAF